MIETQRFRLKEYELICSARVSDDGSFEPALTILKQVWPNRPRTIAVSRGAFATADIAIKSAHEQGIEWVSNFG